MTRGSVRERLGPLSERGFRLFITGYATSVFGSSMTPVAVTFAILDAGGGAADVGYVLAAETIPLVVFLLAGGVVADRFSRRALMLASDLSQAASQLALAVLVLTGRPALWEFRARTWLWSIVGFYAIFHLIVLAPYMVLGAVIAKADLGGSGAWGAILAATGVGGVAAGLVMLRYRPARPLVVAQVSSAMMIVPIVLLIFRAPVAVIAVGACLSGAGGSVFGTLWTTTMQREIPPAILSRVSSYDWFGSLAFLPLGYALVGVLSAVLGINGALWLAVGWFVAGTAALLALPAVRAVRGPAALPPPAGQASTTSNPAA